MSGTPSGRIHRGWILAGAMAVLTFMLAGGWLLVALLAGKTGLSQAVTARSSAQVSIADVVTRVGVTRQGTKVQVTYATPEYYERTGQGERGREVGADKYLVFLVTEENHSKDVQAPLPDLFVNGADVNVPVKERVLTSSDHHRTRLIRFPRFDASNQPYIPLDARSLELRWPDMNLHEHPGYGKMGPLYWPLPVVLPSVEEATPLTPFLFITLTAGLFAALSPCLIQLTLYYLSTLAGVSMSIGAGSAGAAAPRWPLVRTAIWFVAGVVIAYAAGGALAGLVGQYVEASGVLGNYSRPMAFVAGVVIVVMGVYTGAAARAPMLCKLPLPRLTRFAAGKGGFGTMVTGFAIALGCLQCFGGAIFASLLIYVGSVGSPLMGAGMLSLFALGVGIPFILAAFAWSEVVPYLSKVERITPYLALASSGLMILLGVLMIIDKFHWISGWMIELMPFLQA
ncbi:MAG: cytochrome c biogenesis protein CcdA [Bacillota bacterium]